MLEIIRRNKYIIIGAICIFLLFAFMTYVTPLLGDDWGYAISGSKRNPIELAMDFYVSWSGRFLSEVWGFTAANHPIIYKILNPLLYSMIFVLICKISGTSKKVIIPLLVFTLIVTVNKDLRMETYTWLMGETYVIPLCLSLLYYYLVINIVLKKNLERKDKTIIHILNIVLLIIGLMMENIAAAMILGILIVLIYDYSKNKRIIKPLLINLIISIIAFGIMRLSPGAQTRLLHEHANWANLGLIEKVIAAYPSFINMTFLNNNYLILFLSLILIYLVITSKKNENILLKGVLIVIQVVGICSLFSFVLLGADNYFIQQNSLFSLLFWPLYLISVFVILFVYVKDEVARDKCIFYLVVGGSCSLAMLFAPIYGPRSSIYTVFYLFACIVILLNTLESNKVIRLLFVVICLGLSVLKTTALIKKYIEVRKVTQRRNSEARYAREHSSSEIEAWFTAYPLDCVHSGNPDDDYHLQTFGEYLGVPQSYKNIVFYYDEDGVSKRLK